MEVVTVTGGSAIDTPIQVTKFTIDTEQFTKLCERDGVQNAKAGILKQVEETLDLVIHDLVSE